MADYFPSNIARIPTFVSALSSRLFFDEKPFLRMFNHLHQQDMFNLEQQSDCSEWIQKFIADRLCFKPAHDLLILVLLHVRPKISAIAWWQIETVPSMKSQVQNHPCIFLKGPVIPSLLGSSLLTAIPAILQFGF